MLEYPVVCISSLNRLRRKRRTAKKMTFSAPLLHISDLLAGYALIYASQTRKRRRGSGISWTSNWRYASYFLRSALGTCTCGDVNVRWDFAPANKVFIHACTPRIIGLLNRFPPAFDVEASSLSARRSSVSTSILSWELLTLLPYSPVASGPCRYCAAPLNLSRFPSLLLPPDPLPLLPYCCCCSIANSESQHPPLSAPVVRVDKVYARQIDRDVSVGRASAVNL